jgi:bifunctional UDP-N-acetylglucosamine pyrophosphorylase/glucosamine-1-phosphate N-acetyltransferase
VHEHSAIIDTEIGQRVTIGTGVCTVNYDGKKITECKIADDAFIGTGVNLIAPLTIGAGSYVAAGSTITDDVNSGALAIARQYQTNHEGWARRRKK